MQGFATIFLLLLSVQGLCHTDSLPQKHAGMRYVPGGTFLMGSSDDEAAPGDFPLHRVTITGFWMDTTEVSNHDFFLFVQKTGYVTGPDRKAANSLQRNDAMVFDPERGWQSRPASWQQPQGAGSDLNGKELHPVVQVTWQDANAYCSCIGKRLPTEAEWEYAARGGLPDADFPWGNQPPDSGLAKANLWEGSFPYHNAEADGFTFTAPVAQYAPNGYGLYDMAGNVWEWCSDWYDESYYSLLKDHTSTDPQGPVSSAVNEKVIRGGSFLCHHTYCSGYRVSRRMSAPPMSAFMHTGFRCVSDAKP